HWPSVLFRSCRGAILSGRCRRRMWRSGSSRLRHGTVATLMRGSTSTILRSNGPALMEVFRGHAGARQAWESFKGDMQLKVRFDDIRDLGESVLALGEMKAVGQTTRLDLTGELAT